MRRKQITSLQLVRLLEGVARDFDEKWPNAAVFLDVSRAFDTVLVNGLLYKFAINFLSSFLVKTISSNPKGRTFEASFHSATSTIRLMRAGIAQGGIILPVLFSLYINDKAPPSCHVEMALYADNVAHIATSRQPALLVRYLETYLSDLERWQNSG